MYSRYLSEVRYFYGKVWYCVAVPYVLALRAVDACYMLEAKSRGYYQDTKDRYILVC